MIAHKCRTFFRLFILSVFFLFFFYWFCFLFVPESQVQLGPRDGGTDSRIFFLGLHRDTNPGRIHILQAGCKQVQATLPANHHTHNPAIWQIKQFYLLYSFWGVFWCDSPFLSPPSSTGLCCFHPLLFFKICRERNMNTCGMGKTPTP